MAEIGLLNADTGREPVGVSIFTIEECLVQAVIGLEDEGVSILKGTNPSFEIKVCFKGTF